MFYRRSRRLDVDLITDIAVLKDNKEDHLSPPREAWHRASTSLTDGVRPKQPRLNLWYKLRPPVSLVSEDKAIEEVITEIDVLYGEGRPWYGFQKTNREIMKATAKTDSVWLTYRKGVKRKTYISSCHS